MKNKIIEHFSTIFLKKAKLSKNEKNFKIIFWSEIKILVPTFPPPNGKFYQK
jgi:hypothetical protein